MEKHILSKSTFIRGTQCLKSLYLNKKRPFLRNRLSDAQRAVFKRGTDVGLLAQQLFPGGTDMKPHSPALYRKKVAETMDIIRHNSHNTLYEATFQYDRLLVLLDILVKGNDGWLAYEVKSSLKISETFLLDAAFQYYVITHSGVELDDFFLVYIDADYRREETLSIDQLFVKQSVLEEVRARQPYIEEQIEKSKEALNATSSPKISIGTRCRNPYPCDFSGHCWKKVAENSLLYLDAFDENERFDKYYAGKDIPEKPEPGQWSLLQKIQFTSAKDKRVVAQKEELNTFIARYLDSPAMVFVLFVKPAVPYLKNTKPYQLVPITAIVGATPGSTVQSNLFIQTVNPLESFNVYFRKLLSTHRNIVTYDKTEIMNYFKENADSDLIDAAENKLVDFAHLFREGFLFHYLIRGEYSPENIARIFLKENATGLNPALLGMKWQRKLFEQNHEFSDLEKETSEFMRKSLAFYFDFANYLRGNY